MNLLSCFRTSAPINTLEVDFILEGGEVAIEVRGASLVDKREMKSMQTFMKEYTPRKAFIICPHHSPADFSG